MEKKIKELIKRDGIYFGFSIFLLIVTLLIVTVTFNGEDYTLQLPTADNLFSLISYITICILGLSGIFVFRNIDRNQIALQKVYLMIVIPLGILYCLANPLGKVPDEYQHARKSMAISNGIFFSNSDKNGNPYDKFNSKLNELVTKETSTYEEAINRIMINETDEEIYLVYSMATYAPICHMPQAFGMFITRLLGGGISVQCYAARIVNMGIAIFLIYQAIKFIPFKKSIVLFLGLLPITITEFASMSSDALTISSCIFFISYILFLKYDDNKTEINLKDILILVISSVIVSLCKIVYVPLCLLLLLLPEKKFSTKKVKNITICGTILGAILLNIIWLIYASSFLTEVNPGVNSSGQVRYILTHPISYILILFRTIQVYFQTFILSLCGEGLGHYNLQASVLYVFPCLVVFAILFLVKDDKERKNFDLVTKLVFFIIFAIIVVLIYTSLYVAWTACEKPIILGVQARYFLPVLLLTAIVLDNDKIIFNCKLSNRYLLIFLLFFNLNVLSCTLYTYLYGTVISYYIK